MTSPGCPAGAKGLGSLLIEAASSRGWCVCVCGGGVTLPLPPLLCMGSFSVIVTWRVSWFAAWDLWLSSIPKDVCSLEALDQRAQMKALVPDLRGKHHPVRHPAYF